MSEFTIDEDEFEIPTINNLPTLESILANSLSDDFDNISYSSSINFDFNVDFNYSEIGSDIMNVTLKTKLFNSENQNPGSLTVICCSTKLVIAGTSKGLVLAFTFDDEFVWKCFDSVFSDQGGISAIAVSHQTVKPKLIIGYERGNMTLLESENGTILLRIQEAHTPLTAVLNLRFTNNPNIVLCADSTGSVFANFLTKRLTASWSYKSKCVFSGSRGEVCTIEPLITNVCPNHVFKEKNVIAFATFSKIIVLTIGQLPRVIYVYPLPKSSTNLLSLITWQKFPSNCPEKPTQSDALLIFGRGHDLFVHRIYTVIDSNALPILNWTQMRHIKLTFDLNSLHWFADKHLIAIDSNEIFHLMDTTNFTQIESHDLAHLQLVYACAHFKALATGGNVSEAFRLAGERACYNSLTISDRRCFVLGIESIQRFTLRSFRQQLDYLKHLRKWKEMFSYAFNCRDSIANAANFQLVSCALEFSRWLATAEEHETDKVTIFSLIRFCLKINQLQFLADIFWDTIKDRKLIKSWFLEQLTSLVLDNEIETIAPLLLQQMLEFWKDEKCYNQIERLILNVDKFCLDLNQAIKLCEVYDLYDAYIYLMTQMIGDYIEPIIQLAPKLTEQNHKLGNSLFVYISCCFSGMGYPKGEIAENQKNTIKNDVLRCLMTSQARNDTSTTAANKYCYLRRLLKYQIREFLNVLKLAFEQNDFISDLGKMQQHRLIKILLEVVESSDFNNNDMLILVSHIGNLLITNKLNPDEPLVKYVFETLINFEDPLSNRYQDEREQILMALFSKRKLQFIANEQLIEVALRNNCYKFAILVYEDAKIYDNIVNCYLLSDYSNNEVFDYMEKYAKTNERMIDIQLRASFKELLEKDTKKIIEVLNRSFSKFLNDESFEIFLRNILRDNDSLMFATLHELFEVAGFQLCNGLQEIYVELMCKFDKNLELMNFLKSIRNERVRTMLPLTKKYKKYDASVYLYLELNEYPQALDSLILSIKDHLVNGNKIESLIDQACYICEHSSNEEKEKLWLKLLRCHEFEVEVLQRIVNLASNCVDSQTILDTLVDLKYSSSSSRSLIVGILKNYSFQTIACETREQILRADRTNRTHKRIVDGKKAISCRNFCLVCRNVLRFDAENLVFGCGHCYHRDCLGSDDGADNRSSLLMKCIRCDMEMEFDENYSKIKRESEVVATVSDILLRPDLENLF